MQNQILPKNHAIAIIIMFLLGSSLILGINTGIENDSWISACLSMVIAIPVVLIYARILKLFPSKNIYDIAIELFGKFIGKIVILLIMFYAIFLASLVLRNFSEFINITDLTDTPQIAIMISIMIVIFYLVRSGEETIGKWAVIMLSVLILFVTITIILSFGSLDFSNIFPVMNHTFGEISSASLQTYVYPFGEIVLFLTFANTFEKSSSPYKIFVIGLLIGAFILIIAFFRNSFILGGPMCKNSFFPSYVAIRVLQLSNVFERAESLISTNFIIAGITKIAVCLYAASKGASKILNIENHNRTLMPVTLLVIALSPILIKNAMDMFISLPHYKYYALPVQIIIPVIMWITAEIKMHKRVSKNN